MKLFIATGNKDKLVEIKEKLNPQIEVFSPTDFDLDDFDVVEDADTLEGNAYLKAKAYFDKVNMPVISDDTGLFVEALNGKPGVYSARYAGENASYDENCSKLLDSLGNSENRYASFKTVICFIENGEANYFWGECKGEIIKEKRGINGFGYDPIFIPETYDKTFSELDKSVKNSISHRAKAVENFIKFINSRIS